MEVSGASKAAVATAGPSLAMVRYTSHRMSTPEDGPDKGSHPRHGVHPIPPFDGGILSRRRIQEQPDSIRRTARCRPA